jgi:hypothetical protein
MVRFYLWADGTRKNPVYQYPESAVDTYTPNFNITEFIGLCKQDNVKYVFTYEFGGVVPYFNTTLNLQKIYLMLYDSGNFTHISDDATFGSNPRRIFNFNLRGLTPKASIEAVSLPQERKTLRPNQLGATNTPV